MGLISELRNIERYKIRAAKVSKVSPTIFRAYANSVGNTDRFRMTRIINIVKIAFCCRNLTDVRTVELGCVDEVVTVVLVVSCGCIAEFISVLSLRMVKKHNTSAAMVRTSPN